MGNEAENRGKDVYLTEDQSRRIQELEQKNAALESALHAAEEANKAKSRFLSNMSHDIRTPMNAIMGMTSIGLSHIDEKARVSDCLQKIQTASAHLMSLVNDVLDMSRIDSDRMTLGEEPFSLADLVHDISVIVRPQAAQKEHELRIEIGHIEEDILSGDALRLRQILVNIIGNAVKYTPSGGKITVRFAERRMEKPGRIWLDFVCRDNGIGMSEDFLKRIFIPFERVHNEITSKIEGTGLGMSIVKNLVERMEGEILVESKEGAGSCFTLHLPLKMPSQETKTIRLPEGACVFLAENDPEKAAQISAYLREGSLVPEQRETGAQTVMWLTEAQYEDRMPCALLLGDDLPDMSVYKLASHVRELAGREFPILLVSEADWAQIEYRAVRSGISAFVPCPLFKSRLLETLAQLVGGAGEEEREKERKNDYSRYRVLLVEDNELNQEIAVELLAMTGVQVEVADNGQIAVEKFASSPEGYYNIIFMDIHMPVMDGYEATKQIRLIPRQDAKDIWIVAMTADAFVEDVRMAKEAGMNEHISKPVEPGRLQDILYRQFP